MNAWLILVANSPTLMRVIFMISLLAVRSICPTTDDFYVFQLRKWGTSAPTMLRRPNQTDSLPDEGRKGRRADMHEADIARRLVPSVDWYQNN